MAKASPAISNFNAGELSPDFAARVDVDKYAAGNATLLNMLPLVQGPARRRPGTRMVEYVKNSANRTWLRKFIFSQGQAYHIEFGDQYCRFYTNHGQLLNDAQTAPYEIVTPWTVAMLTNPDGSCALQIEQSADVLYIACGSLWPQTLTRKANTNWVIAAYSAGDGPFLDRNSSSGPALWVTQVAGSNSQWDCYASTALFSPSDAASATTPGRLVRLDAQQINLPPWTTNISYGSGDLTRNNGNTYRMMNAASTTSGPTPPTHTFGVAFDGRGGCLWLYMDSGYGIGRVTNYISPTHAQLTVSPYAGQTGKTTGNRYYNFPTFVQANQVTVTNITRANPAVVTFSGSFTGLSVGDSIYLTGIGGMVEISEQMVTVQAGSGATFTLQGIDSTNFTAFTSGGTALRNATLNWQIGAWGDPAATKPGAYPVAVGFFDDRLFWGWGINWAGSVVGQYDSHAQDTNGLTTSANAIKGVIASQHVDAITWFAGLNLLLIGTKGGEFGLGPITQQNPLGPGNTQVVRQSSMRTNTVKGQIIESANFYVQASGRKVMLQQYNFYVDKYESVNQNRLANHIAGSGSLIDADYHAEPYEALMFVRSDGVLITYTYDSQDQVTGWARHMIGGTAAGPAAVECVSTAPAPDGTRDETWMIVRRTINGQTVRSVEYMEQDLEDWVPQTAMCYLDMSTSYAGAATSTLTGLTWLEGETVQIVVNGGGHPTKVVSGGTVTLDVPATTAQVGLACPSDMVKMRIEVGNPTGTSQGKLKKPSAIVARVKNTLGGQIGLLGFPLQPIQPNLPETTTFGQAPTLLTGDTDPIVIDGTDTAFQVRVYQPDPFPIEVLGFFPRVEITEPNP